MLTTGRSFEAVFDRDPDDDRMHDPGDVATFNESMYFNLVTPDGAVAAWIRLGNRPNEGHAEVTVCVYLPDGSVVFHHARPTITGNDRFDAGGLAFTVVEPGHRLTVTYAGPATHLAEPLALRRPREAFADNPRVDCRLDIECIGTAPVYGGPARPGQLDPVEGFADATTLQLVAWTGTITIGTVTYRVDGARGLRDHSWGPRRWQAPDHYRWLTANVGDDGFMALVFAPGGGREARRTGFSIVDGPPAVLDDAQVTFTEADGRPVEVTAQLAWGERRIEVRGTVGPVVPLRHRRGDQVTSIVEGLTTWHLPDGRIGHGFIEFLDQQRVPPPEPELTA